jgi:hypothetical protein
MLQDFLQQLVANFSSPDQKPYLRLNWPTRFISYINGVRKKFIRWGLCSYWKWRCFTEWLLAHFSGQRSGCWTSELDTIARFGIKNTSHSAIWWFFFWWLGSPSEPGPSLWGFTITLRHTTLDEWSVRHRDIYLTLTNPQKGETTTNSVGFEPAIPTSERPHTHAFERAAIGIGVNFKTDIYYVFEYTYICMY